MQLLLEQLEGNVTNINLRREKHGDDRVVAVDISFALEASPEIIDQLLPNGNETFEKMLYTDDGILKQSNLEEMKISAEFDKHVVVLNNTALDDEQAKEFDDAKICKFKVSPRNGHVIDLNLQIQLHPSEEQIHWLTDGYVRELWTIEVKGSKQMDLNLVENEEPEAA